MFVEDQQVIEDQPIPDFNHEQINQKVDTIRFSIIVSFFNKISTLRGKKKSDYTKKFLKMLFKYNRRPQFTYSVLRIILPADDRERGNYGIKQKNLAGIVCKSLNLSKNQLQRLRRYKNPNSHQSGIGTGDFALCLYDIIKGLCKNTSTITISTLNELLDEMVQKSNSQQQQSDIFRKFCQNSNAQQIKWIARIILKDLKLNIKIDHVLNTFHPDGNDYYNLTNSIKETCKKLQNLQTSLNDDIAFFHPIRPMLAGKKNIQYFKQMIKQYFVQTKYDGQRLQVHLEKDKIKVFSRNGVDYNHVYENMLPIFKQRIQCDSCILDGQIIVLQKNTLKMQPFGLNKVVALAQDDSDMQLCYKIFDILWLKIQNQQINLMSHPLYQRKNLLQKVIKQVPGQIQIVQYKKVSRYEQILTQFDGSMERNEEGIMIKDPDSLYVPKERANNWIKLKGDYIDGLTDTLDLIILGGYYGSASYRAQGTHWSDRVTTFLMGVIDKIDDENPKNSYAIPFCKVGTGYKGEQLQQLRSRLRKNLVQNKGIKPSFLVGNWKPKLDDKPDCYINHLPNSIILEVKAAELIVSEAFGAPVTVRFPRVEKIRYDKDWNEAMTIQDLKNMQNQEKYSKNIRRKRAGSQQDEEKPNEQDRIRKKRKQEKVRKNNVIMDGYQCVEIGQQNLKSHLFTNMEFYVFQLQNSQNTKHQVQRQILLNNGKVVQNPLITTQYVISDRIDFKLQLLQKNHRKSFTFIQPRYIFNCVKAEKLLPLSPIYLTILPIQKKTYYVKNFDKFGDSYTSYLDRRELDQILSTMQEKNQTFPIDKKLDAKISLPLIRKQKISLAFGLNTLQKIRLKMHGNKFVQNFSQRPNSIIYAIQLPPKIVKEMNNYLQIYPQTKVQTVENLQSQLIL